MIKPYETYKESGLKWIGDIPDKWDMVSLKYSDETIMGQSPNSDDYLLEPVNNSIPFLQGNAEFNELNPTPKLWCNTANKYSEINDILISVRAPIGAINISNQVYGIGRGLCSVRAVNHTFKYLYYFLTSANEYLNAQGTGSTFTAISTSVLRELKIPAITLKEQTQIATYLDYKTGLIDNIIAQKEELIQKLKEQRQAIINEAVTKGLNPNTKMKDSGIEWLGEIPEHWEAIKFRYKFDTTKGLTITKANLQDEGIPCVNYGEIHSKYGFEVNPEVHNLKYVSEEYVETNKGSLLSKGDFVFADTSEDIEGAGNFTHLNSDIPTFAGYHTIIARLNDNSDYRFVAYFMDSSSYRTQIQNLVKGVKVYSITNKILKDTVLFFPPEEEQKAIAQFIDEKVNKIFASREKLEQSIKKLKEYRQSLISEAVTGKIDIRDWQVPNS
ncbi:restriction endonuclease subunit S [Flavobacteriaceae bacterium S0862]|nr:restriction endonuclease subunit S [Flavobacteriaceae bacterium S0862]